MLQALSNWRIGSRLAAGFGLLLTAQVPMLVLFLHQMSGMAARVQQIGEAGLAELTTSLVRPIREAVQAARTVADGDLASRIDVRSRDETGELLEALKAMASNLEQTAASMEQINATVKNNADTAHRHAA